MATGLGFDNCKEFVPNTKCIIFSILMALLYWYRIKSVKKWVVFISYFLIFGICTIWYANYYECSNVKKFKLLPVFINTFFLSSIYTFAPHKNYYLLFAILYFSYLYMSWFDYILNCQYGKLEPTPLPFGRWLYLPFKDPEYKAKYEALCQEKKTKMDQVDTVTLLILVGIIFTVVMGKILKKN